MRSHPSLVSLDDLSLVSYWVTPVPIILMTLLFYKSFVRLKAQPDNGHIQQNDVEVLSLLLDTEDRHLTSLPVG